MLETIRAPPKKSIVGWSMWIISVVLVEFTMLENAKNC